MLTVSYALFLSVKRIRCWTQKSHRLCVIRVVALSPRSYSVRDLVRASHIDQQQRAVDQGTLASPSQVAAPKRALLMHGGEANEELHGEQVISVS
jgi:hypothetical protein